MCEASIPNYIFRAACGGIIMHKHYIEGRRDSGRDTCPGLSEKIVDRCRSQGFGLKILNLDNL